MVDRVRSSRRDPTRPPLFLSPVSVRFAPRAVQRAIDPRLLVLRGALLLSGPAIAQAVGGSGRLFLGAGAGLAGGAQVDDLGHGPTIAARGSPAPASETSGSPGHSAASSDSAPPRSTETSRLTPRSIIVTPNSRCMRLIVTALWVTIR